jgi:flagellar hook-associated protein 1 FlgK
MSILNTGVSGLNAAQNGILTTSHNIANASTPGYNRQQIFQTTNQPMFTGAGFLGQGTNVETIRRVFSQQLSEQVLSASTGAAEMSSYLSQISQIDNLLADPDAGLSPALSNFFAAVQEMAAYPASLPARQAMLSAGQALVSRFQAIDQRMSEIGTGVNAMITSEVGSINAYAQEIAEINQRIVLAQAVGPNQPANDLLDQRDQLIADLNTKIRATTILQSDGTYSVFIGNGQPLVVGTLPYALQAIPDPTDPQRTIVAMQSPSGASIIMPESLLTGGSLGGLLKFRSETLDAAQDDLGEIAWQLANDFNTQHALGLDLAGNPGDVFFDVSHFDPTNLRAADLGMAITDPNAIAAALPPGGVADNRNALLLGALQTKNTMFGGTATYQSAYSTLVAEVGNKTREVEISGKAQQSMLEQAETARAQLSGVNLDEEAANLLRYQQAYQAAAKMMDVASSLFDEILALGR